MLVGAARRRSAARPALALSLLVALLSAGAAPARAEAAPLAADGAIFVRGHGWGHGRGMGQWGAKGMAAEGKAAADILTHYYSGVALERRPAEWIRVLVESGGDVVVTADEPFAASWREGAAIATSSGEAPFLRAVPTEEGYRVERAAAASGPWSAVASGTVPVVFSPGGSMLQLLFDNGSVRYYRGDIVARRTAPATIHAVNELPLEDYLSGVVPREMPASWEAEALRAQAIAARSYSANKKDRARARGLWYDICSTTSCQVYGGAARKPSLTGVKVALEHPAATAAVDATAGTVMTSGGVPILAEYSSSTGGHSAPGSVPYLKAVPDPADVVSPHHDWSARIGVAEIEERWPAIGRLADVRITARNGYGQWGGRVQELALEGTAGSVTISGHTFRSAFEWPSRSQGLRSTWFVAFYWDAEVAQAPPAVAVPQRGSAEVEIALRNTGNISWRLGGYVRLAAGSSRFADPSWISPSRPAAVSANLTDPDSPSVRRGQVGAFRFRVAGGDLEPGAYREVFRPVADGYSTMEPPVPLDVTVLPAASEDYASLLVDGGFEDGGLEPWLGAGLGAGDGPAAGTAVAGRRALRLSGGEQAQVRQPVEVAGTAGRRFTLGGWSKTVGSSADGGFVGLKAAVRNADGTTTWFEAPFPRAEHEWEYGEMSFRAPAAFRQVDVYAMFHAQTGTAFFDAVRLVDTAIDDPSFERGGAAWRPVRTAPADGVRGSLTRDGASALRLGAGGRKAFAQRLPLAGGAGSSYALAGWSRATGTDPAGGPIALRAVFRNRDGTSTARALEFPRAPHGWAYAEALLRAPKAFSAVDLYVLFYDQAGEAWFDALRFGPNWIVNPSFERGLASWTASAGAAGIGPGTDAARALSLAGEGRTLVSQRVALAARRGRTLVLSGWTRSTNEGRLGLTMGLRHTDGTTTWHPVYATPGGHPWAYLERRVRLTKDVRRVDVYALADRDGAASFDAIRLWAE